jgi:hypothetical protein
LHIAAYCIYKLKGTSGETDISSIVYHHEVVVICYNIGSTEVAFATWILI